MEDSGSVGGFDLVWGGGSGDAEDSIVVLCWRW